MKKIFISLTFIAMIFAFLSVVYGIKNDVTVSASSSDDETEEDSTTAYDQSIYRDETFYRTYLRWLEEGYEIVAMNSEEEFSISSVQDMETYTKQTVSDRDFLSVAEGSTITYLVNTDETGLYEIGLEYYLPDEFYTNPELEIEINGENQFSEMSAITLEVEWYLTEREEDNRYNRYGDEMLPYSNALIEIYKNYLEDENESYSTNYKFLLTEGENIITITSSTHDIYFGSLFLNNEKENISYSSYSLSNASSSAGEIITIEAEDFSLKNSLSIKQSYYKDPSITPFEYKNSVLNILDGSSMSEGGSSVTYNFSVEKTGYYTMCFKYLHDDNLGVVSAKNIYIDGSIPYQELENYEFSTSRKWVNEYLSDENGEYLQIYLTAGSHTLTIESSLSYNEVYLDELNAIMDWINSTGLNVKVITGGETSSIITQYITKYLPTLSEDLLYYAERLTAIYDELNALDDGITNSSPELTCLNVAAKQLIKLAKNPNRINSKLNLFSDGSGSAYQLIGDAITALSNSSLDIDKIYFVGEGTDTDSIPKATSNFFVRLWTSIKSFFYSFSDERYKLKNSDDEETLNVWVEQSSLYADIIQNMADSEDFGFKVKINVLPSVSKLVLSHSTGDNPDVVLSIDTWEPYAMALRGMLEDLSQYDGFEDTIEYIESGNFAPLIYNEGVYGIPETTSAFLLYYRKDILESLNLEVPDTWSDVLEMLYTLQSYSMNFYHPCSDNTSYKSFGVVTPFFYEYNAEVYSSDSATSTLEEENTIEALKFLTELYTVYNLPQQVSSFFESFRSGTIPVGISSIDLYLQLQYAAPEISGQWGVTVLPGIYNSETDEVERWSACYGKSSILFSNSDMKEEGWEFIKWWNSTETQVEYVKNIKMTLGRKYLIVPANLEALRLSVWDEAIKTTIIEQAKWSMVPAVTPGSYIVEREISQIWNKVVIDKVPLRQAISESVPKINRELVRKLDEFGYIDSDGNSTYVVPLSYNIDDWLGRSGDDD